MTPEQLESQKFLFQLFRGADSEAPYELSAILNNTFDAVVAIDDNGTVLYWNQAAATIFGHEHDYALGKNAVEILVPLQYRAAIKKLLKDSTEWSDSTAPFHASAVRKSGEEFPVEIKLLSFKHSKPAAIVGFVRDLSQCQKLESEVQALRDMVENAQRVKRDFLARMSHEMRTPLNGIYGMTQLVIGTPLTDEQRHYISVIKSSTESLTTLISDILDMSEIASGQLKINPSPIDLHASLKELIADFTSAAETKAIDLKLVIADGVPALINSDWPRLRQIIIHLLGNSLKFTDCGSIVLTVSLDASEEDEICLQVSVADTGIGIPPDKKHQLFSAFTQAEESSERRFGGAGIGLTIAFDLVRLMGGWMWLESEYKQGTTVFFTIRATRLASDASFSQISLDEESRTRKHDAKILIADDNSVNCKVLSILLEKIGCTISVAKNGKEALKLYQQNAFDLILMDLHMPEMNGAEAVQIIRQIEASGSARTPIIATTGSEMESEKALLLQKGIDAFLFKPINVTLLYQYLDSFCSPPRKIN